MLSFVISAMAGSLDPSVGVMGGVHLAGPEHELYRSPELNHGPLGPAPVLGLRLGLRLTGSLDLEGEALGGPAIGTGGGLYALRAQLALRGPRIGAWEPRLVGGYGSLGVFTKTLGNDLDPAAHLGPALVVPVSKRLAFRADARWMLSRRLGTDNRFPASHGELLLTLQSHKHKPKDRDADGIVDALDRCPQEPEFEKNGWQDEDGCPDTLSTLLIRLKDAEGRFIPHTDILDGTTRLATTNRDGNVRLEGLIPQRRLRLTADTPDHEPGTKEITLVEGDNLAIVELGWTPGTLVVTAQQRDGSPIAANVWAIGPENQRWDLDEAGRSETVVPPGEWTLMVASMGYDAVTKQVELPNRVGARTHVDITLHTQRVGLRGDEIVTLDEVMFDYDTDAVLGQSLSIIDAVALTLANNPDIALLEVAGHASSEGSRAYNMGLSQRRVNEVVRLLVARGVDRARLDPRGYGESRPKANNNSRSGRRKNRRVEFLVRVRGE